RRFVLAQKPPARRAYELCVLSALRDALRAGNIYLPTSRRYADPETYLIPQTDWPHVRAEVCRQLDLEPTGTERLNRRAQDLQTLLPRLDRNDIKFTQVAVCHISQNAIDGLPSVS